MSSSHNPISEELRTGEGGNWKRGGRRKEGFLRRDRGVGGFGSMMNVELREKNDRTSIAGEERLFERSPTFIDKVGFGKVLHTGNKP